MNFENIAKDIGKAIDKFVGCDIKSEKENLKIDLLAKIK